MVIGRFYGQALFGFQSIKGDDLPSSAAFESLGLSMILAQKVI